METSRLNGLAPEAYTALLDVVVDMNEFDSRTGELKRRPPSDVSITPQDIVGAFALLEDYSDAELKGLVSAVDEDAVALLKEAATLQPQNFC